MNSNFRFDRPLGYQQIVGAASATALTVPAGTCLVLISPENQAIRVRDDGTDPTPTVGYPIVIGGEFQYTGNPAALKIIEQASSATINVLYYGS